MASTAAQSAQRFLPDATVHLVPDARVLDDLFLLRRIADSGAEMLQAQRYKLRRSTSW